MQQEAVEQILAVIALEKDRSRLEGGAVPVLWARDDEELHKLALYLQRILKAMAHDLENGVFIIVKH